MNNRDTPRALFLAPNGAIYPDTLMCSGALPAELGGKPCPFAMQGRFPEPLPLDSGAPNYSVDKGQPGDLCPPCVKQQLGNLGQWQGHGGQQFPQKLLPLRLFKCRQWLWLVVPGLRDDAPTELHPATGTHP